MGYYIYLNEHEFTLQATQYEAVLARWREYEEGNLPYPSSSVFYQYPDDPPRDLTVPGIFQDMGFEVGFDDDGMTIEGWEGKAHSEADYVRVIADLIDEGWYLEWTGEDDERWRMEASGTIGGETVFIRPHLRARLDDLTKMLDEYDETPVAQGPELTEQVIRELAAVGPLIAAMRALIEDLS